MGASYNPAKITFSWAGLNIEGYAKEGFITIEGETDAVKDSVDAFGTVTAEVDNDRRKTITLRLKRESNDNVALSAIFNSQLIAGVPFKAALAIKDEVGSELHAAAQCWIMREPNPELTDTNMVREWVFRASNMKSVHGGT